MPLPLQIQVAGAGAPGTEPKVASIAPKAHTVAPVRLLARHTGGTRSFPAYCVSLFGDSLWSVQEALKAWVQLGVIRTQIVGRAVVHAINEDHCTVAPLRSLLDPMAALTETAAQIAGDSVEAIILFGSVARGEAREGSDIDLAVIAHSGWDGRIDLEDAIKRRLGNDCDALVFTAEDFARLAAAHEPVVDDILVDGIPLIGTMPRVKSGAA